MKHTHKQQSRCAEHGSLILSKLCFGPLKAAFLPCQSSPFIAPKEAFEQVEISL